MGEKKLEFEADDGQRHFPDSDAEAIPPLVNFGAVVSSHTEGAREMDRLAHWEHVYRTKAPDQVSWFQAEARLSLALIRRVAPDFNAAIIDVGAGASSLVDHLLAAGYRNITVLDLAEAALAQSQLRLAQSGMDDRVTWRQDDVLTAGLPEAAFDLWHDRAVFHFLTDAADRAQYVRQVRRAVRPGGFVLVATFAEDGPLRCSGLDVVRYAPEQLHSEFGSDFQLVEGLREEHATPSGARQAFTYCLLRYEPLVSPSHRSHA